MNSIIFDQDKFSNTLIVFRIKIVAGWSKHGLSDPMCQWNCWIFILFYNFRNLKFPFFGLRESRLNFFFWSPDFEVCWSSDSRILANSGSKLKTTYKGDVRGVASRFFGVKLLPSLFYLFRIIISKHIRLNFLKLS